MVEVRQKVKVKVGSRSNKKSWSDIRSRSNIWSKSDKRSRSVIWSRLS